MGANALGAVRSAAVTVARVWNEPVVRSVLPGGAQGTIVGNRLQFILSGLHFGEQRFTLTRSVPLLLLFFGGIYFLTKSQILSSPNNLVSFLDDPLAYLKGFSKSGADLNDPKATPIPGVNCYEPGYEYYKKSIQDPEHAKLWGVVNRGTANILGGLAMVAYGLRITFKEYRKVFEPVAGYPNQVGWGPALFWNLVILGGLYLYRGASDSAGMHQYEENGDNSIYRHWDQWKFRDNFDWDRFCSFQGNRLIYAPLLARGGRIGVSAVNVVYTSLASRFGTAFFQQVPSTGVTKPGYTLLRSEVINFSAAEKAAVKAGQFIQSPANLFRNPLLNQAVWTVGAVALVGALIYKGVQSVSKLYHDEESADVSDKFFAVLGGAAAVFSVAALIPGGMPRRLFMSLPAMASSFFNRPRVGYWAIFSVILGLSNGLTETLVGLAQGYKNKDGYFVKQALNVTFGPFGNRLVYGLRGAYSPAPVSMASYIIPGYFLPHPVGILQRQAELQTGQTAGLRVQREAYQYAVNSSPERRAGLRADILETEAKVARKVRANPGEKKYADELKKIRYYKGLYLQVGNT